MLGVVFSCVADRVAYNPTPFRIAGQHAEFQWVSFLSSPRVNTKTDYALSTLTLTARSHLVAMFQSCAHPPIVT